MFRSGARTNGSSAELKAPRLGAVRMPAADPKPHRQAAANLVAAATELKRNGTASSQATATVLGVGVITLVDDLLEHDLTAHRGKLTDAAHFGELLARAEDATDTSLSEATAAVLCYIGAQFDHQDKLFEQLCRWSLEAGYYATRTGTDPDELLAGLRTDMARILVGLQIPRPRVAPDIGSVPRPRVRPQARVH